jgi:hypothetical protein
VPWRTGPGWTECRHAEVKGIVDTDFFAIDAVALRHYYVLFVIEDVRGVVHLLDVTTNPDRPWATQMECNLRADLENAG